MYARAFMEGRLTDDDLDHFRREIGRDGRGLSSYPHPRLMPDFWEFPTVSMGLGPLSALYQARFNRYLQNRELDDTSQSRVWAFLGDGECDEPESLGALSLASREKLDNLVFVVNCNLQRLDGPVRGNGKVIQELEAVFRGSGWNVIKVILGSKWDELLANDNDGVLLNQLNNTVDGQFQRYSVENGAYIRDDFFGPDPRLRQMVAHLSDEDLVNLPRGGHDYRKLYAAYKAATENLGSGAPTAILCKTIKGWTLGPDIEGRNATHQIKKMTKDQLLALRDRLHMHDEIPDVGLRRRPAAVLPPGRGLDRVPVHDGAPQGARRLDPQAHRARSPAVASCPTTARSPSCSPARARRRSAPRWASPACCAAWPATRSSASASCRSSPTRPARSAWTALFRELKIYASQGQKYEPVDHEMLLSYAESTNGQILEEGITEAGSTASFIAAGTAYATRGVPMVPFYTFYSMFGFQRVGDLIWQAADARTRGFLLGRHRRAHDADGRGPAAPGRSFAGARLDRAAVPGVRPGVRLRGRLDRAGGPAADVRRRRRGSRRLLLHHPVQRELPDADDARGRPGRGPRRDHARAVPVGAGARGSVAAGDVVVLRFGPGRCSRGRRRTGRALRRRCRAVVGDVVQAAARERPRGRAVEPPAPQPADRARPMSPSCSADAPGPIVAVTDFMKIVPEQVARFLPGRTFVPLGTDGMGRSDTRESLRRFFEIDLGHVVVGVLSALHATGEVGADVVESAIQRYGIDAEAVDPYVI